MSATPPELPGDALVEPQLQEGGAPAAAPEREDAVSEPAAAQGGSGAEEEEDDDDDENETCGFCIFMKGGGCKQAFNDWSSCVDREREAGGDFTEECKEATMRLRECMLSNKEYYAPLLEEEEAEAARLAAADNEGGPAATEGDEPAAPSEPEP